MVRIRTRRLLLFIGAVFMTLSTSVPSAVWSQQRRTRPATDDPFKRIGLSRIQENSQAPGFTLSDVRGNSVSLSRFRGSVVFLNFWATWCPPCRQEMPSMERLYRQLRGQGLAMLAINLKESGGQVANFMRNFGLSFPALLDSDGRVSALYRVWGLPTTYVIDGDGRAIGMKSGSKDWASLDSLEFFSNLVQGRGRGEPDVTIASVIDPPVPFPSSLRAKAKGVSVHLQQDRQSEIVATLDRGEVLSPLAKAFGGGTAWYMVKTKKGAFGWVRVSDVEEQGK